MEEKAGSKKTHMEKTNFGKEKRGKNKSRMMSSREWRQRVSLWFFLKRGTTVSIVLYKRTQDDEPLFPRAELQRYRITEIHFWELIVWFFFKSVSVILLHL